VGSYGPYFAQRQVLSVVDAYLIAAGKDKARLLNLIEERIKEVQAHGGRVYVARLLSLSDDERAWLLRTTGLGPQDFLLKGQAAFWDCLGETIWEIAP